MKVAHVFLLLFRIKYSIIIKKGVCMIELLLGLLALILVHVAMWGLYEL